MKIAIQCESPLLQQSLELFLAGHLTSLKQSELVIRDVPVEDDAHALWISTDPNADVKKPFSRSQLMLAIEAKLQNSASVDSFEAMVEEENITEVAPPITQVAQEENSSSTTSETPDFEVLERRIAMLTREYQENIMKAVRAFYG